MITRLFRLERDMAYEEAFNEVGSHNLTTSIKVEPGTLAMYSTHVPDDPKTCYVFEVYADDDAYNVHAASEQFGAFVQMAGKVLTGRAVFPVTPRLMLEKPEPLFVDGPNQIEPHLVFVDVKPGNDEAFLAAITANMRKAPRPRTSSPARSSSCSRPTRSSTRARSTNAYLHKSRRSAAVSAIVGISKTS